MAPIRVLAKLALHDGYHLFVFVPRRCDRVKILNGLRRREKGPQVRGLGAGRDRTTPAGSASSSSGELGSTGRAFGADATTQIGTRRERSLRGAGLTR